MKTVQPVDREMPSITVGPLGRLLVLSDAKLIPAQIIDHGKPLATAAPDDLVARGEQLASVAGCRSCHSPDNRALSESMPRALGNMSDEELDAIWAYLKSVPPKGEKTPRQTGQDVTQQTRR